MRRYIDSSLDLSRLIQLSTLIIALVYRFRMGESSPYISWYEHRLKWVDGELKIHHRKAVLDLEALTHHGAVSIIL